MIDIKSFNSLIELTDAFPTEEVCLKVSSINSIYPLVSDSRTL